MTPDFWTVQGPCPRRHLHTPHQPKDRLAWDRWADRMAITHVQTQCPGCGVYDVWVPRETTRTRVDAVLGGLKRAGTGRSGSQS